MNTENVEAPRPALVPVTPEVVRRTLAPRMFVVNPPTVWEWMDAEDWCEAQAVIEAKAAADAKAAAIAKAAAEAEAARAKAEADAKAAVIAKAEADAKARADAVASIVQCSQEGCRTRMLPARAFWRGDKVICGAHSRGSDISWTLKQRQEAVAASIRAQNAEAKARAQAEAARPLPPMSGNQVRDLFGLRRR